MQNPYAAPHMLPVEQLGVDARSSFITKTYLHLLGAIVAFIMLEVVFVTTGLAADISKAMLSVPWMAILGAYMVVSWIASRFATVAESLATQYVALGVYVIAESLLFVPFIYTAHTQVPGLLPLAALITVGSFVGLSVIAFATRKDFSFLKGFLMWGGFLALGMIVASALIGFNLGIGFSLAMIGFAGAAILYDTSNVLHHYPEDRYVGASLQLFASVALLLWYVIRLLLVLSSSD